MIRLTLRQFRTEALVGFGGLAVLGVVLLVTGPHLAHLYDEYLATCHPHQGCTGNANQVTDTYRNVQNLLGLLLLIVPALVGVFWGAPLVARELETGTFRLVWTQSVTRMKWLAVKLGLAALASMAFGLLLSLMAGWWYNPINAINQDRFSPDNFALQGIAPMGYAVFAFALGAAAGVILRRTVPAMGVTLAGYIGARVIVGSWVRPHFAAPITRSIPLSTTGGLNIQRTPFGTTFDPAAPNIPNAWIYSSRLASGTKHAPTASELKACQAAPGPSFVGPPGAHQPASAASQALHQQYRQCVQALSHTLHAVVTYQPANRFWPFQIYETALFIGLALALGGLCFWWVRRRLT